MQHVLPDINNPDFKSFVALLQHKTGSVAEVKSHIIPRTNKLKVTDYRFLIDQIRTYGKKHSLSLIEAYDVTLVINFQNRIELMYEAQPTLVSLHPKKGYQDLTVSPFGFKYTTVIISPHHSEFNIRYPLTTNPLLLEQITYLDIVEFLQKRHLKPGLNPMSLVELKTLIRNTLIEFNQVPTERNIKNILDFLVVKV